mgnify:CR=1 FL=1
MPCPNCNELTVLFRDIVIPLDRKIIEAGTTEERAQHFAKVIAEFLEAGVMPFQVSDGHGLVEFEEDDSETAEESMGAITKREIERFVKIDLKGLDNEQYFRKHFG